MVSFILLLSLGELEPSEVAPGRSEASALKEGCVWGEGDSPNKSLTVSLRLWQPVTSLQHFSLNSTQPRAGKTALPQNARGPASDGCLIHPTGNTPEGSRCVGFVGRVAFNTGLWLGELPGVGHCVGLYNPNERPYCDGCCLWHRKLLWDFQAEVSC